jgi:hypothetical protein
VTSTDADGKATASLPTNLTPEQALDAVQLTAPSPESGFVYTEPDTQEQVGVFFFAVGDGTANSATTRKFAELWFLDGDNTVLRVVEENSVTAQEVTIRTGKRLPIAQMNADLLITDAVRRQQKSLNYFETLLVRVVETAGFPERYTLNAKPLGSGSLSPRPMGRPPRCKR